MNTESLNFLIGYTENNEILIGEISKRYCDIDNKTTFSFCCKVCYCLDEDDITPESQVYGYLSWHDQDYAFLYQLCEYWECAPQDLTSNMIKFFWDDIDTYFDICYDIEVPGYIMELTACGQVDPREYDISDWYISKDAFKMLMDCWDNYHLKDIPQSDWDALYDALSPASVKNDKSATWVENILK